MTTPIQACCTIDHHPVHLPPGIPIQEAISLNGKTWRPGDTIGVGFLDGTAAQRTKVVRWVTYLQGFVNLKFDFGASRPAIRISFREEGSWSMIGTDCLNVRSGPTMNYGWVTGSSTDASDRAVIVHEFGHAIGLGHEQSSPLVDIKWDRSKALAYFMRSQGWTAEMVESNVFSVYRPGQVTGTAYDRSSIMQYPVPAELTLDGRGIGWNDDLSEMDRAYLAQLYSKATNPTPPVQPPQPPVQPPVDPTLVVVRIDQPAARCPIPAPGQPAVFQLDVPRRMNLSFAAVVQGLLSASPVVVLTPNGLDPIRLTMPGGKGVFSLGKGRYIVQVYNAHANLKGEAWLKVGSR